MIKVTLHQYIRQFHTKKTAEAYIYTIDKFIKLNPTALKFKYDDIVRYLEQLTYEHSNTDYRIRILSAIKKYFDYLVFSGKRNDHPCKNLNIKRSKSQIQVHKLLTMDELLLLTQRFNRYKYLDVRNQIIILLLIYQGLTSEEIVSLDVSNIDLDNHTVYVKASKKLRRRTIEMHQSQIDLFQNYIFEIRPKLVKIDTKKLLINKLGDKMTVDGIHSILEPLNELFPDKELNPKRVRQSVISHWLNDRKLPLEMVMDLSGIKWPSSVLMYKKTNANDQRAIINRFHPLK